MFTPELPEWKREAIHTMAMVCASFLSVKVCSGSLGGQGVYTKIFLQFPKKFWFDTEVHRVHHRFKVDSG